MTVVDDAAAVVEPPPAPPAISLHGVSKVYDGLRAVDGLDLEIPRGALYGLIGPNGAGKTTTFAIVATLLLPTAGEVRVMGVDPRKQPKDVRRVLGYMPDVLGVYDDLSVDEYLRFYASAYRIPTKQHDTLVDGLLELVDLTGKRGSQVNSLSRGMKQRISLARALVHDPDVLVLDEPASGLDPRARVELRELLRALQGMGKTIVVSSHILAELSEMCDEVAIMERGKLLASGPPRQIKDALGGARRVSVRFGDGSEETFTVDDEAAQADLLRRLVTDADRTVMEFKELGGGLEELFLQITKGEVQ